MSEGAERYLIDVGSGPTWGLAVDRYQGVLMGWDPAVPVEGPQHLRDFIDALTEAERLHLRAVTLVDFPDTPIPYTVMGFWDEPPPARVMDGPSGKVGDVYPSITHVT